MRTALALTAAAAAMIAAPSLAGASYIQFVSDRANSTEHLGSFTGSLTYTSNTASTGTLTIVLNDTNSTRDGGYITGILFNIPGPDAKATATLTSATPSGFRNTGTASSGSPFGTFEAGAALGGDWLGGSSPTGGIAAGHSGTLVFRINSANATSIAAADFLANSACGPGMVVRFKDIGCGQSDKVPAIPTTPLPAPASFAGLVGLGVLAKRRRR